MKDSEKLEIAIAFLKEVAAEACICDMDHHSACHCSAGLDARIALVRIKAINYSDAIILSDKEKLIAGSE